MTPQEFAALLDGPAPEAVPQAQAIAPVAPAEAAAPVPGRALAGNEAPAETPAVPTEQPGLVSRIAGDIGTGITELPRAVVKGARDAVQESANFGAEAAGWATGSDLKAPQLPEIDAPKSTTGKLATSVSQFIVGMVGLGKVVRPLEAAAGLAKAGRAAKIATESAKAATVGAVAFDPTAERLGNIVESIPGFSNPFSRFLMAQPGDSRAEGRMKNALESLGMDAALVGGIVVGSKAFRAVQDWKAGKITAEQMQKDLVAAEKAETARIAQEDAASAAPAQPEAPAPAKTADTVYGEWSDLHRQAGLASDRQDDALARELRTKADELQASLPPAEASRLDELDLRSADAADASTRERMSSGISADRDVRVREISRQMANLPAAGAEPDARTLSIMQEVFDAEAKAGGDPLGLLREASETRLRFYLDGGGSRADAEEIVREQSSRLAASLGLKEAPPVAGLPTPMRAADPASPEAISIQRVDGVPAGAPPKPKLTEITDDQVAGIVASTKADADAFVSAGGWDAAVSEGHVFGRGERIPWQRLLAKQDVVAGGEAPQLPLSAFMARVADSIEKDINKARGGNADGVLTDRMADFAWRQRVEAWGDSPQEVLGLLTQAGKGARTALANYEAGLALGFKATQDAYAAAARIRAGDLSTWGGDSEAAHAALKDMLRVIATINGSTEAIKASAGRVLRRTRTEFALSEQDLKHIQGLDGEQLVKAVEAAGGDPRLLKKLTTPSMLERLQDTSQWLLVNNLLWGWKTHAVNMLTNAYMGGARPMERILGSYFVGGTEGASMRAQAWRQYAYMGQSLVDGFQSAGRAWQTGDSILTPHKVEFNQQGINAAAIPYKEVTNLTDILHNIGVAGIKTLGFPTRALGFMDELNKQVVYRSKVAAEAYVSGAAQGLDGPQLAAHVQKSLLDAFDDAGRGINLTAVQEAKIATFSQDLLPNTLGSGLQHLAQNVPFVKIIVPFVRTPTNVLRYGMKMTPGLNLLQAEYRQMLSGKMGAEAQAQAVGQMSMGALFLGAAAWMATSGFVTGGGPSDPRQRTMLMQTGWQPYSFVSLDANGKKQYRAFGKYDPIAMPMGIVADLVDASGNWDDEAGFMSNMGDIATGALMAIAKQIGQKSYLTSLNMVMDAIMDPDRSMGKALGQTAVNFVPAASLLRGTTQMVFDEHMRDARTMADRLMAITPGLSDKVPPKRDVWGDPVSVAKGLWVSNERDAVDAEVRRMIAEEGASFGPSPYNVGGVDLRDIQMVNGRNAYDQYQEWVGRPTKNGPTLKDTVAKIIKTPGYRKAPDGDAGTRGTKQAMIAGTISKFRESAAQRLRADANVREAMFEKQRDVAKAYATTSAPKTPEQQGRGTISSIGRAFGVDLDPLMK